MATLARRAPAPLAVIPRVSPGPVPTGPGAHENRVRTRMFRVSLTFPTVEFSICKRIPPAGCRFAGPEGFEPPPTSVLETGARPLSYVPSLYSCPTRNRPPGPCPGGWCRLAAFVSATCPAPLYLMSPASIRTGTHCASRARCLAARFSTDPLLHRSVQCICHFMVRVTAAKSNIFSL